MSLPVICIITSQQCGHCTTMRGTGEPTEVPQKPFTITGGYNWSQEYFTKLMFAGGESRGNLKFRVVEVHTAVMGCRSFDQVQDFSEFTWNGQKVIRTQYRTSGDANKTAVISGDSVQTLDTNFSDFLKTKIPLQIFNYMGAFPSWAYFTGDVWDGAIKSNSVGGVHVPLKGYLSVFKIKRIPTPDRTEMYGIDRTSGGKKPENSITTAAMFLSDPESMMPSPELIDLTVAPGLDEQSSCAAAGTCKYKKVSN
jgi:hypothetical protein